MEKLITFCGQTAKVACDEKCNKAWGSGSRPRVYIIDGGETEVYGLGDDSIYPDDDNIDIDDYAYLADDELGEAPKDPETYEGGQAKPTDKSQIGNKWCIRECERCSMSDVGKYNQPLELQDFSKRNYNCPPYTR